MVYNYIHLSQQDVRLHQFSDLSDWNHHLVCTHNWLVAYTVTKPDVLNPCYVYVRLNYIFRILHLRMKEYTLQAVQEFMSQNREKTDSSNISYLQIPTGICPIIQELIFK